MKRLICIILVLLMFVSLISCGKKDVQEENDTTPELPTDTETDTEVNTDTETEEEEIIDPKTIWNGTLEHSNIEGFYDPEYDYSANPRYKVCVFSNERTINDDQYEAVFQRWCDIMNIEFGGFIKPLEHLEKAEEQIRQLAGEYDGIILRGDFEYRFSNILNEECCPWMYWGDEHRDENGNLLSPVVTFSNDNIGAERAEYIIQYFRDNLPSVPAYEVGIMFVTFSGLPVLEGIQEEFCETINCIAPELSDNIVILDMNIPYDVESFDYWYDQCLQTNAGYKYWLCDVRSQQDMIDASEAFSRNGIGENSYIYASVNPEFAFSEYAIPQAKAVFTIPFELQLEPIIGALYGFMTGELSPETIWGGNENGCGSVVVEKGVTITRENYADFCQKLDKYMS